MDPNKIENWQVHNNDGQLIDALRITKKRTGNTSITILDYQKKLLNEALQFVKKWNVAIDGGAHYGIMTYHLNYKFNKVHSFEINPPIRDCLIKNIKNFELQNVEVHNFGLGEKEKLVSIDTSGKTFGTFIDPTKSEIEGNVLIKSIDSLNLNELDFIKLDCEGYESFILEGGIDTILKFKPVILMERKGHSARWGLDKFAPSKVLEKYGYKETISYGKDCIMTYEQ